MALLLFDEVELLDVAAPLEVLTMAGRSWNFRPFKIYAVAARPGTVKTLSQVGIEARHSLIECPSPEIVIVPGGYGARRALADADLVGFLERAGASATQLLAVGNGVLLLAKAALLADLDVCASQELVDLLRELSPSTHVDTQAGWRESGKVITSATSGAALDAALHIVSKLLGKKQALSVAAALGLSASAVAGADVEILKA